MKNNWSNFLQENFIGDSEGILSTMNEEDAQWYVVDFLFQDNPTPEKYAECQSVINGNKYSDISKWVNDNIEIKAWLEVIRKVESMINDKSLLKTRIVYHWNYKYLNTFKRNGVTYNPDVLVKAFKIAEKGLKNKKSNGIQLSPQEDEKLKTFFRVLKKHGIVAKVGCKYTLTEKQVFYVQLVEKASKIIFGGGKTNFAAFRKHLQIENEKQSFQGRAGENDKYESKIELIISEFRKAIATK